MDVIAWSTTGMTLRSIWSLRILARRMAPKALIVAGGMEATFRPELMFELGPFDLVVLGEGERPSWNSPRACVRARRRAASAARPNALPMARRFSCRSARLRAPSCGDAIFSTPYEKMPYALLGPPRERLSDRRAAEQGCTRGASRRDPFGAAHHAQLLPDGLHVLFGHKFSASRQAMWPRSRGSRPTNA